MTSVTPTLVAGGQGPAMRTQLSSLVTTRKGARPRGQAGLSPARSQSKCRECLRPRRGVCENMPSAAAAVYGEGVGGWSGLSPLAASPLAGTSCPSTSVVAVSSCRVSARGPVGPSYLPGLGGSESRAGTGLQSWQSHQSLALGAGARPAGAGEEAASTLLPCPGLHRDTRGPSRHAHAESGRGG